MDEAGEQDAEVEMEEVIIVFASTSDIRRLFKNVYNYPSCLLGTRSTPPRGYVCSLIVPKNQGADILREMFEKSSGKYLILKIQPIIPHKEEQSERSLL